MKTRELLNILERYDIDLECEGNILWVIATEEAFTPEIRAELLKHKPVLLAMLTAEERMRSLEADQAQPEEPLEVFRKFRKFRNIQKRRSRTKSLCNAVSVVQRLRVIVNKARPIVRRIGMHARKH